MNQLKAFSNAFSSRLSKTSCYFVYIIRVIGRANCCESRFCVSGFLPRVFPRVLAMNQKRIIFYQRSFPPPPKVTSCSLACFGVWFGTLVHCNNPGCFAWQGFGGGCMQRDEHDDECTWVNCTPRMVHFIRGLTDFPNNRQVLIWNTSLRCFRDTPKESNRKTSSISKDCYLYKEQFRFHKDPVNTKPSLVLNPAISVWRDGFPSLYAKRIKAQVNTYLEPLIIIANMPIAR